MRSVRDVDLELLRWVRSHATKHEFDLKAGDEVFARLRWTKPVGSLALAESADGEWTFKRSGFLTPMIIVRDSKTGHDLALMGAHLSHSSVQLPGGRRLDWTRTGLLVPGWRFRDPQGKEVVSFEPGRERLTLEGGLLSIEPSAKELPELTMLLILGWYFIVLAWVEDQAIAASSAVLSATVGP